MNFYKIVSLPIEVSDSDYCWDGKTICTHFDNEGGHGRCDFNIGLLKSDKTGYYPKPEECLGLKAFKI
jgi:hypothetical protein